MSASTSVLPATPPAADAAIPGELAILPTRDAVLLPMMGMPATIAGEPLLQLLEEAVTHHTPVAIVAQRPQSEPPTPDELRGRAGPGSAGGPGTAGGQDSPG